jgi:hypothetical protein
MLSLANDLVTRAARFLAIGPGACGFWTISVRGRLVGALACEAGRWRLTWFEGADPRLIDYAGRLDGDIEALSRAFGFRLGQPVQLDRLAD